MLLLFLNNIIVLIIRNHSSTAQASSSLKWLNMRTSTSTTPTLITKALRYATAVLNSDVTAYTALAYVYWATLPQTMYFGTDYGSSDHQKAKLFNKFFYSIFNNSSGFKEPHHSNCSLPSTLSNISFTSHDIMRSLLLKPNKAMGTDNINPKILKYCVNLLCDPIHHLFQIKQLHSY